MQLLYEGVLGLLRSSQPKGLTNQARDRLKGRYADPKHPLLEAVIRAEPTDLPPIALMDER